MYMYIQGVDVVRSTSLPSQQHTLKRPIGARKPITRTSMLVKS